jgi:hypothetical protein
MQWPWRRFESFFERHLLRRARDTLENQRDLIIAAINANSSYDGSDEAIQAKVERIEEIERSTVKAVNALYAGLRGETVSTPEEDAFENDPLFRQVRLMRSAARTPVLDQASAGRDMLDSMVLG